MILQKAEDSGRERGRRGLSRSVCRGIPLNSKAFQRGLRFGRLIIALFLSLAGCTERKQVSPLDFAAYGDCRHNKKTHTEICASIAAAGPRFVLATGDMVDHGDAPELWAGWRDTTRDLRSKSKYYCAAGNHDLGEGSLFLQEMGLDRLYYDQREGDFHVFILDSNDRFADPRQLEWLERTASASDAKHKFAVFHHPPFMIDRKRGEEAKPIREAIHPLLVKLRFCAAFCGHQHAFYTTKRDGVRYVVTAGGGAPLWDLEPSLGLPSDQWRKFYHFVGFRFATPRITGHVFGSDGVEAEDLAFTLCEHQR